MKNNKNLPKEQIGIAIPILSLLLGIFPFFRTFTTLMTFIYSEDISSILFTKAELIIYLLLSVLIIISLILICLRKTFAIYTYYLFTLLTLLTQIFKYGFSASLAANYILSIAIPALYFYFLYKKNYIFHLKEKTNTLIKIGITSIVISLVFIVSISIDTPRNNIRKFERAFNDVNITQIESLGNLENSNLNITEETLDSVKINDYNIKEINKIDSTHKTCSVEFKLYFISLDENKSLLVNDEALKNINVNFTKVKGKGWRIDDIDTVLNELLNK
ncbi:MAG: hypothetical protein SOY42_05320 [Clostridium sp.]|nr:hypothetical protein [Clostridium sp.]